MKHLTCNKGFVRILEFANCLTNYVNHSSFASKLLFYRSYNAHLQQTNFIICSNFLTKRTFKNNVNRVLIKDQTFRTVDFDTSEQFISTSESKPCRKPSPPPTERTKKLFSVSNICSEAIDEKTNSKAKPQALKAIDLAIEIRKQKMEKKSPFDAKVDEELDSTKRALKALSVPRLDHMTDENIARLIRRSVIYADQQLVIFNKPYGLAMHDGDNTSKHIKSVLPMVSKMVYGINTSIPLTICNRLDKYTTGICVTTANKQMTVKIQRLFREHKILKKYWAVTLFSPDPGSGVVDIPIDRKVLSGDTSYARMVVKPTVRYNASTNKLTKVRSKGQIAITHYRMLDRNILALVELQPMTTIKHQLRVHLADGLDCPILGDHKYSHFGKLAPQVLPSSVLRRLGIPFSKSRHVPMHMHLHSILIPDIFPEKKKPNLIIGARLPHHMSRTMRKFGLKPGVPTKWKGISNLSAAEKTAEPRDKDCELYVDPTLPKPKENTVLKNIDDESIKVIRRNCIKVKYKPD